MCLKGVLDGKHAAYEDQNVLSITHVLQGLHWISEGNFTF
jgi:hypothetical protein